MAHVMSGVLCHMSCTMTCLVMDRMVPVALPESARLHFLSFICSQSQLEIAIVSDCGSLTSKGSCKFHNIVAKMPAGSRTSVFPSGM